MSVVQLSDHVHDVVEQERAVVASRVETLRAQSARLHALVERLDHDLEANTRLLRQMDEMLGLTPQLSLEGIRGELRGKRLREIAIELLRQKHGIGTAIHYTEWYELLIEVGAQVGGKDPLATFLTQIARAPQVESVKPRSGLYRLKAV